MKNIIASVFFAVCAVVFFCHPAVSAPAKKLRMGFVYVSPAGSEGFSYTHDLARKQVDEADDLLTTTYAESVPEGPDAERVFMNIARKKTDIVVGTSYGYMEPMLKVAKEFPDTVFLHCSGDKATANLSNFFGRIYQARYLTGMVAGAMTKKNAIGYVAAHNIPEVIRGINAFTLGVQAVNPKAEVRVVWTSTWFEPIIEAEAAQELIAGGVDVLTQHQDSPAVQKVAEKAGIFSIGYHNDMSKHALDAHLVAAVWNWAPFYERVVREIRENTWKSGSFWFGMDTGIVDISNFGKAVPEAIRTKVKTRRQEIIDGTFTVFSGPVYDQSGKERVSEGSVADDKMLQSMDWLVKGVVGTAGN